MAGDEDRYKRRYGWLSVSVIGILLMTVGIAAVLLFTMERRMVVSTGESLALLAADMADKLDETLFERYGDINIISKSLRVRDLNPAAVTQYLNEVKETYLYYRWLGVTDAQGRIIAATDPGSVGQDRSGAEWFRAVREGQGTHLRDIAISEEAHGVRTVGFAAPIVGAQGEVLGVVTTQVGLSELEDVLTRTIANFQVQQHESGPVEWQIIDRKGQLIVDSVLREEGHVNLRHLGLLSAQRSATGLGPGFVEELHQRRTMPVMRGGRINPGSRSEGQRLMPIVTGYARTEGYGDFPGFQWSVLVRLDRDAVLAPIRDVWWRLSAAGALMFLPAFGLLWWAIGRLQREAAETEAQFDRLKGLHAVSQALQRVDSLKPEGFSLHQFFQLVVETAVRLTRARYGAVGQFDQSGKRLVKFVTTGMEEPVQQAIGEMPTGRGLLGILVHEDDVLRLKDLTQHPTFSGFPPHHPTMHSFLGASIRAHGRVFGRIYLTEKREAKEFSELDEQVISALAAEAGVAIENGYLLNQIRDAEMLYRTTMYALPVSVVRLDQHGTIRFANPRFCELMQGNEPDLIGQSIASVLPVDGQGESIDDWLRIARARSKPVMREVDWVNPAGELLALSVCVAGLNLAAAAAAAAAAADFILVIEDLTEKKQAEQEREKLTQDRLALMDATGEGIYGLDLNGCCTFINKAGAAMLGYEPDELLGQPMHALIHHTRRDGLPYPVEDCSIYRAFRTGQGCRLDDEVLWRKDGTWFPAEFWSNPITAEGRITGSVAAFRDITETQQAREALRESEARFRQLAEHIRQVFWMTSPDKDQMMYVSPAYEDIWGRTCKSLYASPLDWLDAIHPEDRQRVFEAAHEKQLSGEYCEEYRILRPDGAVRFIRDRAFPIRDVAGRVVRIVGVAEDVTTQRQIEERLRQAQKLEAVGQLAGGIAHDFNNLLTVINGYSEMLLLELQPDDPQVGSVQEVLRAGERAAALTQQLLTFSRKQTINQQRLNLNEVVNGMEQILRRLLGEPIEIDIRLAADLGCVKADIGQMEQVLVNLAINARDAMPEGGRLVIETTNVDVPMAGPLHPALPPGVYVRLAICDQGVGMDAVTRTRIFEPFFTTKPEGKGTGLGLATVYGIVQQSAGHIEVDSELGRGTTFAIYLPQVDGVPEEAGLRQHLTIHQEGSETILLVEDEESVRSLTRTILSSLGYTVLEACSGEEAIRINSEHSGPIHLLLTDVVMPGMNGRQVASRLIPKQSGMKVLYMSGYADDVIARFGTLDHESFLQKPFTPYSLAWKVRKVLDAPEQGNVGDTSIGNRET